MDAHGLEEELQLALELGVVAAEVALPLFHAGVETRWKADGGEVTEADLSVERRLMELLAERRPGEAILSEEHGAVAGSGRRWILDPIDGTAWFARGEGCWGTHVALEQDGEVVLGVITRPLEGTCLWAVRGVGAFRSRLGERDGAPLQVSSTATLAESRIAVWDRGESPIRAAVHAQARFSDSTLDAVVEVLDGKLEAVVDCFGEPWDLAPAVVLVEEAGGCYRDFSGGRRIDRTGGCFSNGAIGDALRALIVGASGC